MRSSFGSHSRQISQPAAQGCALRAAKATGPYTQARACPKPTRPALCCGPQLTFTPDAREKDVTIVHHLKLYESEGTPNNTKKPVMNEVQSRVLGFGWQAR